MFEFLIEPFICFLSYISYLLYKCCEFDDVYLLLSPILHEATLFFSFFFVQFTRCSYSSTSEQYNVTG